MMASPEQTRQSDIKRAFDDIAESWYRLRHWSRFTAELEELAQRWQGGRLLNIGCAHGADFLPFRNFQLHGVDFSLGMIHQAQRYVAKLQLNANLIVATATCLPFAGATFDGAIAIAVYHHIPAVEERERALVELKRVLKPGGEAFVTVWNRQQPRFWFSGKEVNVPWRLKDEVVLRYHYLFSYSELKRLLLKTGFKIIGLGPEKAYRFPVTAFSRNICALVRKPG